MDRREQRDNAEIKAMYAEAERLRAEAKQLEGK
jgi:hypothetical protein